MSNRTEENRLTYERRKQRQADGVPGMPMIPAGVLACEYPEDEAMEAEWTAAIYARAAFIRDRHERFGGVRSEDKHDAYEVPAYSVGLRNGSLVGRCA